jgi:hypothetical protein
MTARAVVVGAVSLALLTGCSASSGSASSAQPIKSDQEVALKRFECLKAKGWDVTLDKGAIFAEIPEAQRSRYDADDEACLKQAGYDPDAPITDEQFTEIYASYIRIQKCLKGAGWSTPQRPSLEGFKATYETEPWIPWSSVPPNELPDATDKCPEMLGNSG